MTREVIGLATALVSLYMLGMGVMRVVRRVDLAVEPRHRIVSVGVTVFILAAACLGFYVAASYFR
jgi:hypothetical protein